MFGMKKKAGTGAAFTFRVSDVVDVPLRGVMLRLGVQDGTPSMGDLSVGKELIVRSHAGAERRVRIVAHALVGGNATQKRLERTRELDVVVAEVDAGGEPIGIGWTARGPG
jgi:hypothetical protein